MDPIAGGAVKQIQGAFQEAEQQIEKSGKGVSDFEKLREKLEQQDAMSVAAPNQTNPTDQVGQVQQAGEVEGVQNLQPSQQVGEIKNMDELQGMVDNIKEGQTRLNEIISEATSGKTYSPSEMLAMQAEVGKITTELEMATKVVENFVSSVKTTLNIQF
jgi:hypothetical protein